MYQLTYSPRKTNLWTGGKPFLPVPKCLKQGFILWDLCISIALVKPPTKSLMQRDSSLRSYYRQFEEIGRGELNKEGRSSKMRNFLDPIGKYQSTDEVRFQSNQTLLRCQGKEHRISQQTCNLFKLQRGQKPNE